MTEKREIALEQFGEAFVRHVVTPERIRATIERVASRPFEVGPIRPLPLAPIEVVGSGSLRSVHVERVGVRGAFTAEVTLATELVISIASVEHRYRGTILARLRLQVVVEEPLVLVIAIDRPERGDVDVRLAGDSSRAEIVKILGNVRGEVARQVARVLRSQLESERAVAARRIDITAVVDAAWKA